MWAAFSLWYQAKQRAGRLRRTDARRSQQTYASRTMRWGGVIVLAFIIYHLLDLTAGAMNPAGRQRHALRPADRRLHQPLGHRWYVIALVLLGMHLRHGVWSATQTLGQSNKRRERTVNAFAIVFAVLLTAGFLVVPLAIAFGASWTLTRRTGALMPLDLFTVGDPIADTKAPLDVPLSERWSERKFRGRLVNPANRRRLSVIVVGTGLAGGSAAATLGELGYKVKSFWYQDSPRRAHSVAAQGGINAAKNYRNDGDSVYRLFYDTVKGGDFRSRESNSYRLAEVSVNIIDQAVAQGVPVRPRVRRPARQPLLRWRAGLAHLLRPRPDRPAAALRRLPGAGAADGRRQRRAAHAAPRCST